MMQQTVGDGSIDRFDQRNTLKALAAEGDPVSYARLFRSHSSQRNHWFRRINAGDATSGKRSSEANVNIARATTQVEHVPLGKIGIVFTETIDESLVLFFEICLCIDQGLFRVTHQLWLQDTRHHEVTPLEASGRRLIAYSGCGSDRILAYCCHTLSAHF